MNDDPKDPRLLDHEYDGIRELDNSLPRWWVWLFYLATLFAAGYLGYYHGFAKGDLAAMGQMKTEYQAEMKAGDAIKARAVAEFESQMISFQPSTDATILGEGRTTFLTLCAPCHRPDAGGLVGPNLTDDYWIHGSNYVDNLKTIWNGVPAKGMITWKGVLKPATIQAVGSYIYTLRGTHPPKPKPREDQAPVNTGPSVFE